MILQKLKLIFIILFFDKSIYVCPVKKSIAFILLSVYVFSATEFQEFMKLPVLLEHYHEHTAKNISLSFSEFLFVHYAVEHPDDGDSERDAQLPFRQHTDCLALNITGVVPNLVVFDFNTDVSDSAMNIDGYSDPLFSNLFIAAVWQPPKTTLTA